ncbi:hypothetical protein CAEBREN_13150 [Caenorhabditis brenneri]|uniref:C2H2-type domain-containing protein n=1 Tax=Caenorhabditis brenneri TaxID=135651 RepID=G0MPU0_CAEBE|nr:hypothetical protein CAEBREN_13150 [Caenorhabditis brenneri]
MPHTVPLIGRELCFWCVEYTESGKFVHPPNGSTLPISSVFNFPKIPEKPQIVAKNEVLVRRKSKVEIIKAFKSEAAEYNGGRACDKSRKVFLCDFCEFSFTLHHNLQKHLIRFHGDSENISSEKLSLLKETFDRMDKLGREESKKELVS